MKLGISEILKNANEISNKANRIKYLQENNSITLQKIFELAYHPAVKWALPPGPAPYEPSKFTDSEGMLYSEMRRMYLFLEGGNTDLSPTRREMLFVQLLECLDAEDAKLILSVKEKKIPYKNINETLVREAFPGILPDNG